MPPQRIFLARHGETDWNRAGRWQGQTDIPLNLTGQQQARELSQRLSGLGIERIVTSDLLRAYQTGQVVANSLGLAAPTQDRRLRERSFGVFEGLTRAQVQSQFPEAWTRYQDDRRHTPPEAERFETVVARVSASIAANLKGPSTLLVAHGGCMRAIWTTLDSSNVPLIPNAAVMEVTASMSQLGADPSSLKLYGAQLI